MRMGIKGTITPSACSWTPAIIAKSCFDNTRLDPHNDRNGSRSGCMYWLQIWTSFEGIFGVTPNTCVMKVCCSSAHQKSTFLAEKQKSKDTLYTVMQPRYPSTSQEVVSAITSFMCFLAPRHRHHFRFAAWSFCRTSGLQWELPDAENQAIDPSLVVPAVHRSQMPGKNSAVLQASYLQILWWPRIMRKRM